MASGDGMPSLELCQERKGSCYFLPFRESVVVRGPLGGKKTPPGPALNARRLLLSLPWQGALCRVPRVSSQSVSLMRNSASASVASHLAGVGVQVVPALGEQSQTDAGGEHRGLGSDITLARHRKPVPSHSKLT